MIASAQELAKTMRLLSIRACLICGFALMAGCNSLSAGAPAPLTGTYWRLVELRTDERTPVDPALGAHLVFEDGRVSGSSGCNRLTGSYTVQDDSLRFSGLAGTRMACAPPAMMLEQRFLAALEKVDRYRIEGEMLLLYGARGALARFEHYLD